MKKEKEVSAQQRNKIRKKTPTCSDLYINGTKMRKKRLMIEISSLNSWSNFPNFLLPLIFPKPLRLVVKEQENELNEEITCGI